MGAKVILGIVACLLFAQVVSAVPQQSTAGPYQLMLTLNPDQPQSGQQVEIRLGITKDGELQQNFTAAVHMLSGQELIYKLEGEYPTSELLIPYQFPRPGAYVLTVDIPGQSLTTFPLAISGPPPARSEIPLSLRILIVVVIIGLFWKFKLPHRKQWR